MFNIAQISTVLLNITPSNAEGLNLQSKSRVPGSAWGEGSKEDEVVFMDESTYEQLSLPHALLEDELPFMQPSSSVQVMFVGGTPSGVDLPASIVLEVTETEPGVKGDTVSNVTKPATLETGAVIQVPLFVNVGDKIKLDPREKRYIQRA